MTEEEREKEKGKKKEAIYTSDLAKALAGALSPYKEIIDEMDKQRFYLEKVELNDYGITLGFANELHGYHFELGHNILSKVASIDVSVEISHMDMAAFPITHVEFDIFTDDGK